MASSSTKSEEKKFTVKAELQREVSNLLLETSGSIPEWLSGTLVRNGPVNVEVYRARVGSVNFDSARQSKIEASSACGPNEEDHSRIGKADEEDQFCKVAGSQNLLNQPVSGINGRSNSHWFDGLAMLHAFTFDQGKVGYSNKFLRTDAYHTVFDEGSLHYAGFAVDPCRSLWKRFLTFLLPASPTTLHNANVNIAKIADAYIALTEVPLPIKFDLETLETLGVLDYHDTLPKDKSWESAHPHHDASRGVTTNYLIRFGRSSSYVIYEIQDGSSERKVIAEVPVEYPAYMHSFSVTPNYIVLTEYPFVVKPRDLMLDKKPFIKNYKWLPEMSTRFTVIDKISGKVAAQYHTDPLFAFHHANAFEQDEKIHLDLVAYPDASIITGSSLYVDAPHDNINKTPAHLKRFTLKLKGKSITSETLLPHTCEFPRINEKFDGHPYRYCYLTAINDGAVDPHEILNSNGLYKVDTETKKVVAWSESGCLPGEPVFVPSPEAIEEDDGVVLAVVIDRKFNHSFLLILDGKTFKEIGRARTPLVIPAGLHAQYFH